MRAGAGLRGGVVLLRAFCVPAGMSCVRSRRSCGSIGLFCARSRRSCVPVEMSCVRLMSVVRFYWDVLAFVRACHTFLSGCLMFDHACCLPPVRQTERLAICSVPVPPWVGIAIRAFSDVAWLSNLAGSLRACAFLYGDPDGERRDARDGERSRRRGRVRFCASISTLRRFPRGVRWGLRAPKPAPRRLVSLDSRHLGRDVGAFHAAKGTQAQRRLDRLQ